MRVIAYTPPPNACIMGMNMLLEVAQVTSPLGFLGGLQWSVTLIILYVLLRIFVKRIKQFVIVNTGTHIQTIYVKKCKNHE